MKISNFSQTDQQAVADFWLKIFEELGWIVNYKDGFDDISAFFHLPNGLFLIIKDEPVLQKSFWIKL